jgi:CelD/BcsL family acetyltransferase involved in cellulose biosynthesis
MDDSLSEHRPGWLFTVESIRHAIQHGKERFNFLRGDEDYKRRIGAQPTVQQRWLATSPRLIPRLRGAALQKGIEVRDWFRGQSPPVTASLEDERGCKLLEGC